MQDDHQLGLRLALPQTGPALVSSWGCLHPSSEGPGASALYIPSSCPPMKTSQVLGTSSSIHCYFCAHSQPCLAVLQRSAEKRKREKEYSFFIFIFASNTFLIIWRWGRKLKDIKPAYPDTCSNSCSNSSSDSDPAELPKVPAQPHKLPPHPGHSGL